MGACAIAPVQQNVTGLPIVRIVNHIRCESRVAIQKKALDELRKYGWHKYRRYYSALADQLEPHVGEIWPTNIYLPELDKAEIGFYNRYMVQASPTRSPSISPKTIKLRSSPILSN